MPLADPSNYGNRPGDGPLRPGGESVSTLPATGKDLPDVLGIAAKRQQPALAIVRHIAQGTERVRAMGETYLPKAPGEDPANYNDRLMRSVFFNAFARTVEGLTGLVFKKDPELDEDVPEPIVEHWENIDLAGTHGDVFVRQRLDDTLTAGHCAILVDYPDVGDSKPTLADEKNLGLRPYWVPIRKDDILSWRTVTERGRTLLSQVVIRECAHVADGAFGEKEQTRYRVINRTVQTTGDPIISFRLLEITDNKAVIQVGGGLYRNQTEIPLAEIISSGRRGLLDSDPPLLDLAYTNIAHYQTQSDYFTSMHLASCPLYVETGVDTGDEEAGPIVIGPNNARSLPNGATAQYVEHSGSALGASKIALDDLKADMATLGLSMLASEKRAAETATAKRIDKAEGDSALSVTARGLQDGIEQALGFHAKYLLQESGGSVIINREFENLAMDSATIAAYSNMVSNGQLSLDTMWAMLKQGGALPEEFDADEEQARLDAAVPTPAPMALEEPPTPEQTMEVTNPDGSPRFTVKKRAA